MHYLNNSLNTALFILCITILTSCSKGKIDKDVKAQLALVEIEKTLDIKVDSTTVNKLIYPQLINSGGRNFLTSINIVDNSLKFFDLATKTNAKTIRFEVGGQENFGKLLSVHVLADDSILYLDKSSNLFLLDEKLNVVKKHKLKDFNEKGLPLFYDNVLRPIKSQNKLTVPNYYTTMTDRHLNVEINLENGELNYKNPVPKEAVKGFYGMSDFEGWNYVFDESKNTFIFNYPALDSLYEYDQNFNLLRKIYGRSSLQSKKTEKLINVDLETVSHDYQIDRNKVIRKIKSSFVYSDIIFNKERNEYYRLVALPISDFNIDLQDPIKSEIREYSIMVFDKSFNIKKEYLLPFNKYMIKSDCFFVYDGKLHLQKRNENEDYIEIDILKL